MFDFSRSQKVGIGLVAVVVVALLLYGFLGLSATRGASTYTGQVVDIEHEKGLFLKTSQVHLKTNLESSEAETFCVHPSEVDEHLPILRRALRNNQQVTISYSRPLWVSPSECQSGLSMVDDVEINT